MSSESDKYAVLVEALVAGGYAPAAISNAKVAASRGLGARTTHELVAAADPAAGKVAAAIFGSHEQDEAPAAAQTPDEAYAAGIRELDQQLREAVGFGPAGGEE